MLMFLVKTIGIKVVHFFNFPYNFLLQMCKWQSIEGEEKVTTRLVELLEKMRLMLYKASQTGLVIYCSP